MTNSDSLDYQKVASRILLVRGYKVILDSDLAQLYGVSTKALNQAVKRNLERFPGDFMFRLDSGEVDSLNRSQVVTGLMKHRDERYAPYAFTEHGAMMVGNVLRSDRAIEISLMVVRTFVKLREMLVSHKELAVKLETLERKLGSHDKSIAALIDAIRKLTTAPEPKKRSIGFVTENTNR
jgi:hypothetical protein